MFGDKTELKPWIVLAVDGSVNVSKTFRAQVGDSFVITKDGYEQLIEFSKDLGYVVIKNPKTDWNLSIVDNATQKLV